MTSHGFVKAKTADFMPSTPKTVSSALHPAQMRSQTPTLLLQQERALSSQTLLLTLIITPYGGRVLTITRPRMQSTGRDVPGTARLAKKKALTPTAVSQLPQEIARALAVSLKTRTVFRFRQLSSAAAAQLLLLLFISQEIGITAYS